MWWRGCTFSLPSRRIYVYILLDPNPTLTFVAAPNTRHPLRPSVAPCTHLVRRTVVVEVAVVLVVVSYLPLPLSRTAFRPNITRTPLLSSSTSSAESCDFGNARETFDYAQAILVSPLLVTVTVTVVNT